ncbi:MAG TPA: MmgE/PrpD family protein [Candidatus Binatia bacterium]
MVEETLSERLARRHATLQLDEVPLEIVQAAKLHILDSLGCLLAGSRLEPGKLAYALATGNRGSSSSLTSTLLGAGSRVSFLEAVQAMSVAAHCGEMDDIHGGAGTCIGGIIMPPLVAMVEEHSCSGCNFLEAAIVGYETTARVGLAIDAPRLFSRGWWPSTVCGVFGVAAAGAKFLGWTPDQTANALGIASLNAGGMITGGHEGATARHLVFGRAAQSGVLALLAARQGFTGPRRAFEDPRGFCLTLCPEPKWEYLQAGEPYCLPAVAFKPYPCARQLHAGVEALLRLLRDHAITPSVIETIELFVPTAVASLVNRPAASMNRAAVLGSGQYVMAVTAMRGKMDLVSFEDRFMHSNEVRSLMVKVNVKDEVELDRYFPHSWPGRVRIGLKNGACYTQEIIVPKGEKENPMSSPEVEEKFLSLAAPVLGDGRARSVIDEVRVLEERKSLDELLALLRVPA